MQKSYIIVLLTLLPIVTHSADHQENFENFQENFVICEIIKRELDEEDIALVWNLGHLKQIVSANSSGGYSISDGHLILSAGREEEEAEEAEAESGYSTVSCEEEEEEEGEEEEEESRLNQKVPLQVAYSSTDGSLKSKITAVIANNPELQAFIKEKRKKGFGARRIADAWSDIYPDHRIHYGSIEAWFKLKGFPSLRDLSTKKRKRQSLEKVHLQVAYRSTDGSLKSKSTAVVDNNPELQAFIRKMRKKGWGAIRIADAWKSLHPEERNVYHIPIRNWLREKKFPSLRDRPKKRKGIQ